MNTDNLFHRCGKHVEGIIVADIILRGERNVLDIREGFDFIPGDAGRALRSMFTLPT